MLKRPHYIALGVVIVGTLGLLKLPNRAAANLKLAISGMCLPLFGAAGSAEDLTDKASYALLPRRELVRQIGLLQKTNRLWQIHFRQAEEWKRGWTNGADDERIVAEIRDLVPRPSIEWLRDWDFGGNWRSAWEEPFDKLAKLDNVEHRPLDRHVHELLVVVD